MDKVTRHVEKLFNNYPKSRQVAEMKEEVVGNLRAEIEDLQQEGKSFDEAFEISKKRMGDLSGIIETIRSIDVEKFVLTMFQWTVIYCLIAWIVSIPMNVVKFPITWTVSIPLGTVFLIIGIVYVVLYLGRKLIFKSKEMNFDLLKVRRIRRVIWVLWAIFMVISWGMLSGLHFGSNIWFGRSISISGPYEFAVIMISYVPSFLTIVIPLIANKMVAIIQAEGDEDNGYSQ